MWLSTPWAEVTGGGPDFSRRSTTRRDPRRVSGSPAACRPPSELPPADSPGVLICAIAGAIIGLPTLRLRGDYIAIVTLAFGEIIGRVFANGDSITIFGDNQLSNAPVHLAHRSDQLPSSGSSTGNRPEALLLDRAHALPRGAVRDFRCATPVSAGPGSPCARMRWAAAAWACRSSRQAAGLRRGWRLRGRGHLSRPYFSSVNANQFMSASPSSSSRWSLGGLGRSGGGDRAVVLSS